MGQRALSVSANASHRAKSLSLGPGNRGQIVRGEIFRQGRSLSPRIAKSFWRPLLPIRCRKQSRTAETSGETAPKTRLSKNTNNLLPLPSSIEGYFRPSCLQRHKKVTTAHRGVGEGGARRARRGGGRPKSPGNAKNKVRSRILPSIILTPLSQSQLYSCSFASHSRLFCAIRYGAYKRRLCMPLRRVVTCFAVFGV